VLLGTLYPLFIDALGLGKLSVGPPYFNSVFAPLMVPALFLMALGPFARWKHASLADMAKRLRSAFVAALVVAIAVPLAFGQWTPLIALGLLLATWIIAGSVVNVIERVRATGGGLLAQPRSWYGMHLAHLGIAVFVIGVTMVKGYESEKDVRMEPDDTVSVGGYTFRFVGVREAMGPNYRAMVGELELSKDGKVLRTMNPEKRQYLSSAMPMTEAAIDTGLLRDVYVSLGEPIDERAWSVRVYHKPFVDWIWGGCLLMALGGLVAMSDRRYRLKKAASARVVTQGAAA
jgi:cytochrome c-type biogenesis protein CcmF